MEIDLVVFDMSGTAVLDDDGVNVAMREALAAVGVWPRHQAMSGLAGTPSVESIRMLIAQARGQAAATAATVQAVHDDFLRRLRWHVESYPGVRACDGAADLFVWCRARGIKTALDTGLPRPLADILLGRLRWQGAGLFDAVVVSDETDADRAQPGHIQRAMAAAGVTDARRVMVVGDAPADITAGVAAGCGAVVALVAPASPPETLRACGATHVIERLLDIRAILAPAEADAA